MDDLKLYGKMMQELDSLVQTVIIFSSNLGMQVGISQCAFLEMKRGKIVQSEELELQIGETIKSLEDERDASIWMCYNFNNNKGVLLKDRLRDRKDRKILKASLNAGSTIQAINARVVSIIRYGTGIVEQRKNELEAIDWKTRKLPIIYRSLHPRADVDRLYWESNNSGKGFISVEVCFRIEKTNFYLKEQLLTEVEAEGVISDDKNLKRVKTELLQQGKENYTKKRMHSAFMRLTEEVSDDINSWLWMKKGYLEEETERLVRAAQDQLSETRWVHK